MGVFATIDTQLLSKTSIPGCSEQCIVLLRGDQRMCVTQETMELLGNVKLSELSVREFRLFLLETMDVIAT